MKRSLFLYVLVPVLVTWVLCVMPGCATTGAATPGLEIDAITGATPPPTTTDKILWAVWDAAWIAVGLCLW